MTQGMKLYYLRSRLMLSVSQVAGLLGIDRGTLYRYERDEQICSNPEILEKLSHLYQVPVSYLAGASQNQGTAPELLTEKELLELYRKAGIRDRMRISGILRHTFCKDK